MTNGPASTDTPVTPGLVRTAPAGRSAVLLTVAQAVAAHSDLHALLHNLADALRDHLQIDYLSFSLIDPVAQVAQLQFLQPVGPARAPDPADTPTRLPARESPTAVVWESQKPLWLAVSGAQNDQFPTLCTALRRQGVQAACFVPLTTPRRRLGAMAFTSYRVAVPADQDIDFLAQIGRLVALAVEATLSRRELEWANERLRCERDRLELLFEVGEAVSSRLDLPGLLRAVAAGLRRLVGLELIALWLPEAEGRQLRVCPVEPPTDEHLPDDFLIPVDSTPPGEAYRLGRTVRLGPAEMAHLETSSARWLLGRSAGAFCAVPLRCGDAVVGVLSLMEAETFTDDVVGLLEQAARPVAVAVANALAYRRIEQLTARLAQEKLYLEEEIRTEKRFDEIVGDGPALRDVLRQVAVVAPTDSAVLILGETGTGKELIARAVHRLSYRRERTFVKLNCAAIPSGLLESELFGHEKGAFTGAVERRIGRFELADGGTLFLDEIGDIPLELQPKLLRVLQEQELERLGSGKTIKVNVRVVAATHRDLARLVAEGAFRSDLYYRLHVFPVRLPPLRDRREDIPGLVRHFAKTFARRLGKGIDSIPAEAMAALQAYHWPGNVRELEHLVERAVILSSSNELRIPLADVLPPSPAPVQATVPTHGQGTLRETERELIRRTLEDCGGVIGGRFGAASRLGLKRTTLLARMKKLGLHRPPSSRPPHEEREGHDGGSTVVSIQ
jgi:formate hydrogenlyase transcriptional activator